ncbi:MAG: Ger(x)C family spore germination protein [Defluviitaleaceae bacterium]|nr:Ger(x)C family spore germination protein [Defluviitaleaceae bacterium]
MLSINEKISLRQLQALIIISAMGTGVIVLPRRVAEYAGSDGWMMVLGLMVLAMLIGALVATAARLRPTNTFIESTGHFLTRPVAYFLGIVLWAKLVFSAGLELRAFLLVVHEVLLRHTPIPVTGATMLILATYAAIKGIETRARVAEVLLMLMIIPFALLLVLALMDTDWSNLQPVLTTPPQTMLNGTLRLGFLFTGLECLLLVSPYVHPEKKMRKAVVSALGVAGIIITIITVLTLASFGRGVVDRPWPVLAMMDMLTLPGAFIERQEALVFSFWIITTFALVNALVFFGGVLIKDCMRRKKTTHNNDTHAQSHPPSRKNRIWQIGVIISAAAVFVVAMMPWDEADIYNKMDFVYLTAGVFFLVVLPIILILASKLRGKKHLALLIFAAISLGGLTGCYDKVEIEDRAFVVAIGIDKASNENERYTVTLSLPAALDGGEGESEDEPQHLKKASGQTITEAIKQINADTNTQLYFGQAKLLVLGDALLEESDLVRGALGAMDSHPQIARQMHILASCTKAADILAANPPGEALPGQYVTAIYKDKRKIGGTSFLLNLEMLTTQIKYTNSVLIPSMQVKEDELDLSGAVVLKNSRKIGKLNEDELRGYLWHVSDAGQGAVITAEVGEQPVPFKVEKHKAKIRFAENENNLQAHIYVELTGRIDELASGSALLSRPNFREHVQHKLEDAVKDEILKTAHKMQHDFALDGYNWLEIMRKKQYSMYQRHVATWDEIFTKIDVIPHITVTVKK